jgi:hypothetical protein
MRRAGLEARGPRKILRSNQAGFSMVRIDQMREASSA